MASSGRSRWWGGLGGLVLMGGLVAWWWPAAERRATEDLPASEARNSGRDDAGAVLRRALRQALTAPRVQVAPVPTSAVFEGDVVDDHGKGIPGAELVFEYQGAAATEHADATGHFVFHAEPPGRWTVGMISAPSFRSFAPEWGKSTTVLEAERGGRVDGLRFELRRELTFYGRVVDVQGRPVVEASVLAVPSVGEIRPEDHALTDADGGFVLPVAGPSVRLFVVHSGYDDSVADYRTSAGEHQTVSIELAPAEADPSPLPHAFRIHGALLDDVGRPIHGLIRGRADGTDTSAYAFGELDGGFTMEVDLDGGWTLTAAAKGYGDESVHVEVPTDREVILRLASPSATLSGHVTDETGAPVKAFRVVAFTISRAANGGAGDWNHVFSADGHFALSRIVPGQVQGKIEADGFIGERFGPIEVAHHGHATVDVVLRRGARIVGTVAAETDGRPLPGILVTLEGRDEAAETGADGSFEFKTVPVGVHSLTVWAPQGDFASREVPSLEVLEQGTVGPLRIALRPVDPRAPKSADYEGVGIRWASMELEGDGYRVGEVHPQGGARLAGIQPGDLVLAADGTRATEVDANEFIARNRGPDGTVVRLTVRRGAQTFDVNVARRRLSW